MCPCRGLFINLYLDTKETRRLGLTAHVCELQFVLLTFDKLLVWTPPTHLD